MSAKLLELYKGILRTAGLEADSQGYVKIAVGDEREPAVVNGKPLVLPTSEQLRSARPDDRTVFHPLSENILRGESDVLAYLRKAMNVRLNTTFALVSLSLLQIAASPAEHAKLSPDQQEFLSRVKDVDEKTYHTLVRLIKEMPVSQTQQAFVSIYLKRSGTIEGRRYSRVGVISFPLYHALKAAETTNEVYGVKMRVKDRESLLALLEYMVPRIGEAESHHVGSDSRVAPYLDALMQAVAAVAGPLNDVITLFANVIDDAERMLFDSSWVEAFENLNAWEVEARSVPMQAGNEGSHAQPAAATSSTTFAATPQTPATPTPTVHPTAGYQGYPQPAQPQPPQMVKTSKGLDFNSVLAANPVLAYQVGAGYGAAPVFGGNPMMNMQRQPRWAAPAFGMQPQPVVSYQPGFAGGYNPGYGSAFGRT